MSENLRRAADGDFDQWRGGITASVEQHERRLREINGDLTSIRLDIGAMRVSLATVKSAIGDQHDDVKQLTAAMRTNDHDKQQSLLAAVERARASTRNLLLGVLAPFAIAIGAGLIIYALTGAR